MHVSRTGSAILSRVNVATFGTGGIIRPKKRAGISTNQRQAESHTLTTPLAVQGRSDLPWLPSMYFAERDCGTAPSAS